MNHITMRKFGNMGRWANQLFQYAFLRDYADAHELELQLPRWVGEELFGIHTARINITLPQAQERYNSAGQPLPPNNSELANKDFLGWAQFHTGYVARYKHTWWELYRPIESIENRLEDAMEEFANSGRTTIGIHIRRGDYGQGIFYLTPIAWYLKWLEQWWHEFNSPILFIASEDRSLVAEFAAYNPVTVESLGVNLRPERHQTYNYERLDIQRADPVQLDFYPDFYFLSKCDVLVTPNSTFSFAAGLCNPNLKRFFRSNLHCEGIVEEQIWNTWPLQHDDVRDFPYLEGVKLDSNPYW